MSKPEFLKSQSQLPAGASTAGDLSGFGDNDGGKYHEYGSLPKKNLHKRVPASGFLAPQVLYYGDGRHFRLKYYQYSSNSATIATAQIGSELDNSAVDIEFDTSIDEDSYIVKFSLYRLWQYTGPGWLMSIAYLDPGNLESDLQAGAIGNYDLIWVLFWATVLGWCLQTLSARLGVVTGRHLAQICRYEYNKPTALLLWIFTELAIIGSDIQEVVGSAVAFKLLFGWPLWIGCLVTAFDAFTFLLLGYLGMRALEAFFCSLIGIMAVCFAVEFAIGNPDMIKILEGWALPLCESNAVEQAVGMVGAVIMPHNLFLHSALVQTRNLHRNHKGAVKEGNYYFALEGAVSLFVSFLINLFIVSVFAKGFYGKSGASSIGLTEAGEKLQDEFGTVAKYVWAIGLLAAGQSSTMTGTFAGQYAMQGFLDLHWSPWKRTLLTRTIALGPSLAVAIAAQSQMDTLDEWLNVQQSVQLPFALLPLLFFNSNPRVMGQFTLSKKMQAFYWIMSILIISINVYLTIDFAATLKNTWIKWIIFSLFLIIYLGIILYLVYDFYSQGVHSFRKTTQIGFVDENDYSQTKSDKKQLLKRVDEDTNDPYYFANNLQETNYGNSSNSSLYNNNDSMNINRTIQGVSADNETDIDKENINQYGVDGLDEMDI